MADAYQVGTSVLDQLLEEGNSWGLQTFAADPSLLTECQGMVRACHSLGYKYIEHLEKIPWLFARLAEPGIAQLVLEKFDAFPLEAHHRLSIHILGPNSPLRAGVEAIAPDGSNISARLMREVQAIRNVPFDDCVAEQPHSICTSIKNRAPGCGWAWLASTARLKQNIAEIKKYIELLGMDI